MKWRAIACAVALVGAGCEGGSDGGAAGDPQGGGVDTQTAGPDTSSAGPDVTQGAADVLPGGGDAGPGPGPGGPDVQAPQPDGGTIPVDPGPRVGPTDAQFQGALTQVLDEAAELTVEDFVAKYTPADMPQPFALTYDPTASAYFDGIANALSLTPAEIARVEDNGFVVSERLQYESFGHALLHIYQEDLPVLVTSDMILHALHSSYDEILKTLEKQFLIGAIDGVLAGTHDAVVGFATGDDLADAAKSDADLFLTVARSLLAGQTVASKTGVDADVAKLLDLVKAEQMVDITLFGVQRKMDFSQFKPRGHYEGDPELERYFRAMIWLGRADLRFMELDPFSGQWSFHVRQLAAAWLLASATDAAGAVPDWQKADSLIGLMVGDQDYITLDGVRLLAVDYGFAALADITGMTDETREALTVDLLGGKYGAQKINSHWLETNPFSSEPTPLPPSFAYFGQRFVVDSYVFANVVYDTVVFQGAKVPRVLPDPLDALFVLGNDQVIPHLVPMLDEFPYQGNLHSLRFLVDWYDASFWGGNLYNRWLTALRTLNAPTTHEMFPEPMRTPAWRDRILNTQLASWAQLRHDTILYAKQSYTGGVSCEHPDGYVEPYPELYEALGALGADARARIAAAQVPGVGNSLDAFFANWEKHMGSLKALAEKELAGEAFTDDDVLYLKTTVMGDMGCGAPVFSGWYPTLFYPYSDKTGEWDPTIADVHTNPNSGPLPGPNVLHVATGNVNLMVLTSDTCDGPEAYVGPVFSYYEVDVPEIKRLADSDWEQMLIQGPVPARPEWTESFLVPAGP